MNSEHTRITANWRQAMTDDRIMEGDLWQQLYDIWDKSRDLMGVGPAQVKLGVNTYSAFPANDTVIFILTNADAFTNEGSIFGR
jgi:hypothetical protein